MADDPKAAQLVDEREEEERLSDEEIEREIEAEEAPAVQPKAKPVFHKPGQQDTFLDKAWDLQYRLEARVQRVGKGRYARVIKMARKPEKEEYYRTAKVTAIGLAVLGFVGFVIFLLMKALKALLNVE